MIILSLNALERKLDMDRMEHAVQIIGGKWKLLILSHLCGGIRRFNELRRLMPRITPRTLSLNLRDLERDGMITRTAYREIPPWVEYALSEKGSALVPALDALRAWSTGYADDRPKPERETSARRAVLEARDEPELAEDRGAPAQQPARPERRLRPWGATAKARLT